MIDPMLEELRAEEAAKVVVLCLGNPGRGDDGFGPAVAAGLAGMAPELVFDCRTALENDLPRAAALEPDLVVIVDAVHFDGRPGELRVLEPEGLREDDFSTHAASPSIAARFLRQACGARVVVLAARPKEAGSRGQLSAPVREAAERAVALLGELLGGRSTA